MGSLLRRRNAKMEELRKSLNKVGISSMKFYSEMPNKAQELTLERFENFGGIILAIKMLDEGVDIPSIDHALSQLLTRIQDNIFKEEEEFSEKSNKHKAVIHDLIITPPSNERKSMQLNKNEIIRAINFNKYAINEIQTRNDLEKLAKKYNVYLNYTVENDDFNSFEEDLTESENEYFRRCLKKNLKRKTNRSEVIKKNIRFRG